MKNMRKKPRKGMYLLPNFLTTMSLLSGFYAIVAVVSPERNFAHAAIAIFVSCLFDMLDGRVARLTHSTSRFGVEYDSLCDLVAFGVAPGVVVYLWAFQNSGNFGWLAAFLFVACGAVRLARFNVQVETVQKKSFLGLPIPAAAAAIAGVILFTSWLGYEGDLKRRLMPFLMYALAFLMVSNIRYYSFKDLTYFKGRPFRSTVAAIILLVIVLSEPQLMLLIVTLGYVFSGPVYSLVLKLRKPAREEGVVTSHSKESPADLSGRR